MSITNNTKKLLGQCDDFCLKPGKIKALKMLDLQTKSTINSICFRVQLQATNLQSEALNYRLNKNSVKAIRYWDTQH
jgi:hypothetical protein